jgi:hypothetical protein
MCFVTCNERQAGSNRLKFSIIDSASNNTFLFKFSYAVSRSISGFKIIGKKTVTIIQNHKAYRLQIGSDVSRIANRVTIPRRLSRLEFSLFKEKVNPGFELK